MNTVKFDNVQNVWINGVESTTADMYAYHVLSKSWVFQAVVSIPVTVKKSEVFATLYKKS